MERKHMHDNDTPFSIASDFNGQQSGKHLQGNTQSAFSMKAYQSLQPGHNQK